MTRLIIEGYFCIIGLLLVVGLFGSMYECEWPRFKFIWYDLWIGAYYDRAKRLFYVLPFPCLVIIFQWRRHCLAAEAQVAALTEKLENLREATSTKRLLQLSNQYDGQILRAAAAEAQVAELKKDAERLRMKE